MGQKSCKNISLASEKDYFEQKKLDRANLKRKKLGLNFPHFDCIFFRQKIFHIFYPLTLPQFVLLAPTQKMVPQKI